MKIKSMILVSMFAAVSVVGAKIQIPSFYGIPITCQVVCALLAGLMLGPKLGAASQSLYLFMGIIGLPVFATTPFGGPGYVLKLSFGFIIGFIAAAFVIGIVSNYLEKIKNELIRTLRFFIAALSGLVVVYIFGISYAILLKNLYLKAPMSLGVALGIFILPFLITDLAWCIVIGLTGERFYQIKKRFIN